MIVFDGEDICVHYHEGRSDFLLVTFIGVGHEDAWSHYYFSKTIVEKQNINCLGIATKKRNWYVTDEMQAVFDIIKEKKKQFAKIITMAPSAGGYAALRYSVFLQSDYTFVFAPVLTPQLLADVEKEAGASNPSMEKMRIKELEVSGNVVVFYDKKHAIDQKTAQSLFSFNRINFAKIHILPVPHAGHIVYENIKGEAIFSAMISYAQNNGQDITKLYQDLSYVRRRNYVNIYNKLMAAYHKHPLLCYNMLISDKFIQIKYFTRILEDHRNILRIIAALSVRGYTQEAANLFMIVSLYYLSGHYNNRYRINQASNRIVCIDCMGGVLSYSLLEKRLKSAHPVLNAESTYLVYLTMFNSKFYPSINHLGNRFFLKKEASNIILTQNVNDSNILYSISDHNETSIQCEDRFLSVLVNCEVSWEATAWLSCEKFSMIYL